MSSIGHLDYRYIFCRQKVTAIIRNMPANVSDSNEEAQSDVGDSDEVARALTHLFRMMSKRWCASVRAVHI